MSAFFISIFFMKVSFILLFLGSLLTLTSKAQNNNKYQNTDTYVTSLGQLDSMTISDITQKLTSSFSTKELKARAIFYWIAQNIQLDIKAQKRNPESNIDPVDILKKRSTTTKGFATLFQEMCSQANIRCLTIDGYTKTIPEEINTPAEELNHYWNMIQLGNSNENWYLIDVAKAAGYTDFKKSIFTKSLNGNYFFHSISLFYQDHFPKNKAWLFGKGPKNLKEFYALPIIGTEAYALNIENILPITGQINAKVNTPVSFAFSYTAAPITALFVVCKSGTKLSKPERINYDDDDGTIRFDYTFKKEDELSFTIMNNDKPIITYQIIISE